MIEPSSNPDLDNAYALFEQENFKKAISIAKGYFNDEDPGIRITAMHISAIAHFHIENYSTSSALYKTLCGLTNQDNDWFNLCTSAVLAGQDELGDLAIEKATAKEGVKKTSQLSGIMMRYYYAQALADAGRFLKAKVEVKILLTVHGAVSITESDYLLANGNPTLYNTLDLTRKVFEGLNKDPEILKWLNTMKKELDEEGQQEVNEFIAYLKNEN